MSDDNGSPVGGIATPIALPADAPESFESPSAAAAYFTAMREKPKEKEPEQSAESAEPATAEQELPDEGNADPVTDPGEVTEDAEPAEVPPIERPRSWAKELDEEWASYPREAQEKIAKREQERDTATRRSQNEAAEIRKAAEAERQKVEQVRQEYEAKLPAIMQMLQSNGQFADIQTMQDVKALQANDPFRFQAWQLHQMELQAVNKELTESEQRKSQEQQNQWASFVQRENALAAEKIPELADDAKAIELTKKAVNFLHDLGFTDQELADQQTGRGKLSLYDHRLQLLIHDGLKYRDAKAAPAKAITKPLPPVQKPGISRAGGIANSERIQALTRQLNETGDIKIAQELHSLQTRQRRAS